MARSNLLTSVLLLASAFKRKPATRARRHDVGMSALPLELCHAILWYLPPANAWPCRAVCRAWRIFIEDRLSRDWLIGSLLIMIHLSHPRIVYLYPENPRDEAHEPLRYDVAFQCVARQRDYLVFEMFDSRTVESSAVPPPSGILQRISRSFPYLSRITRRAGVSSFIQPGMRLHVIVYHAKDDTYGYNSMERWLSLHTRSRLRRMLKRGNDDFEVGSNALRINWKVLFSGMFSQDVESSRRLISLAHHVD